jgi:AraC family transcriptional regulator
MAIAMEIPMTLNVATKSSSDHVSLRALFAQVSGLLENCAEPPEKRIRSAGALLREYPFEDLGLDYGLAPSVPPERGGLPVWKIKRVMDYIESHIGYSISIADLAGLIGLSPWHFCRAFRTSLRESPHGFVMRRRIARSQSLMAATRAPLSEIALECGFADQAHFSRVHARLVGVSPGTWRRTRQHNLETP